MKKIALIAFLLSSCVYAKVCIVLSAALTDAYFEFRKTQYIESINILAQYGYHNPYVIEALRKQGPTFLDDYTSNVFYSTADDPRFRNKGINEARTMLQGIIHFNFNPDDLIIKLTGRYQLISDKFIKLVKNNPDIDAFVMVNEDGNVFTLGFAMRCKYMREMYENMDWEKMEHNWINVEHEVGNYIKRKKRSGSFKVKYIKKLYMKADLFGSSTAPGIPAEIREW